MPKPRTSRQTFFAQTGGWLGSALTPGFLAPQTGPSPTAGAVSGQTDLQAVPAARAISRSAQR